MSALDDFLGYAEDEIGYTEDENGRTKFGTYFGDPDGAWCAYFIAWCADQAGIMTSAESGSYPLMPDAATVTEFYNFFDNSNRVLAPNMNPSSNNYPMPGDLVTIKSEGYSSFNHIGIVYKVNGNTVTTIEGNCSNKVKKGTYTNLVGNGFGEIIHLLSNHKSY